MTGTSRTHPQRTDTGNAIRDTLMSPNESDANFEPANVVDGLFAIARAIDRLAAAIAGDIDEPGDRALSDSVDRLASRLRPEAGQ